MVLHDQVQAVSEGRDVAEPGDPTGSVVELVVHSAECHHGESDEWADGCGLRGLFEHRPDEEANAVAAYRHEDEGEHSVRR